MNSYNIGLEDRKIIEEMYNAGAKPCEIAARIGKCQATIYREIKRGEVPELNARCRPAYRAEVAEKRVTDIFRSVILPASLRCGRGQTIYNAVCLLSTQRP